MYPTLWLGGADFFFSKRLSANVPQSDPFLPYVGTILQSMVNLHELPTILAVSQDDTAVEDHVALNDTPLLVHFAKWRRIAQSIKDIKQWQRTPYLIEVQPELQFLLQSRGNYLSEEDAARRSDELEPPSRGEKTAVRAAWFV